MPFRTISTRTSTPLPAAVGGIKIIFQGTHQTAKWANVMHAHASTAGPFSETDLTNLAASALSYYNSSWMAQLASACTLLDCLVQDLSSDTGLLVQSSASHNGGIIGTGETAQVSIVVSWKIARHYKGGHPRTYLPGIPLAAVANSTQYTSTFVSAIDGGAGAFRTGLNSFTAPGIPQLTLGSYSYYHGYDADGHPLLRDVPIFDPFVGHGVDTRIDTQRRRLGKPPISA